ncbi:MAG: hypothetical protein ACLGSD_11060 [Acidobacteriota bacterium]
MKPKLIQLVSDTCPVVHGRDSLTLDWNPEFDYDRLVEGLRTFTLTFSPVGEDGVNVNDHQRFTLGGGAFRSSAVPTENGYFHIEIPVLRGMPPGTYHLVDASSTPVLPREARNLSLKMWNSPVDSRFCITVVSGRNAAQQPANNAGQ